MTGAEIVALLSSTLVVIISSSWVWQERVRRRELNRVKELAEEHYAIQRELKAKLEAVRREMTALITDLEDPPMVRPRQVIIDSSVSVKARLTLRASTVSFATYSGKAAASALRPSPPPGGRAASFIKASWLSEPSKRSFLEAIAYVQRDYADAIVIGDHKAARSRRGDLKWLLVRVGAALIWETAKSIASAYNLFKTFFS